MKKLLSFCIAFSLVISIFLLESGTAFALGSSVWEKRNYKDAFGDPTEEWYIINKKSFTGSFNNGEVENARLGAEIIFDLDGIYIVLYENGADKLKNKSETDIDYTIQIKQSDGEKVSAGGTLASGDDRIEVWGSAALLNALNGNGKISVYLERDDQKITNYLFSGECGNFSKLLKEELYKAAKQFYVSGDFVNSYDIYLYLDDYKDSKELADEALHAYNYVKAQALMDAGKYQEAITAFEALGTYRDSAEKVEEAKDALYGPDYAKAEQYFNVGKYEEAISIYKSIIPYKDSEMKILEARAGIPARDYAAAEALLKAGKFEAAIEAFEALGSYQDSAARADEARDALYGPDYAAAEKLRNEGKFEEAVAAFKALGDYKDSREQIDITIEAHNAFDYAAAEALRDAGKYEEAIAAFEALGDYKDSREQIIITIEAHNASDYATATALRDGGRYEEAITAFTALEGYRDSSEQITETQNTRDYAKAEELLKAEDFDGAIAAFMALGVWSDSSKRAEEAVEAKHVYLYAKATAFMAEKDYESALEVFEALDEYRDSAEKAEEVISSMNSRDYAEAEELLQADQLISAVKIFESLADYRDSKERAEVIKQTEKYRNAVIAHANAGDTIVFGSYEQDDDTSNGKEAVEWLVLVKENDKILVVSKYALDRQPYHSSKTDGLRWSECALRKWLNQDFLNTTFTSEEQSKIPYEFSETDKVSLLRRVEVEEYMSGNDRKCYPTEYAKEEYLKANNKTKAVYWALQLEGLVSLGPCVNDIGGFSSGLGLATSSYIRPAIWIDLSFYAT